LDSERRTLTYVNAGHNPPLLFGAHGAQPTRLEVGGPVIGLFPKGERKQGRIELRSHDLLVAFTDGITEATDPAGEEWGEDGLIDTIRRSDAASPETLIERVLESLDAFTAGAMPHDDMTLVVVRAV